MAFSTAVQLEDVWKRFGAVEAVRGVSLRVPAGCIYGLLGPNGAGKTTLIRMIMSIFFADSGRIGLLDGQKTLAVKDQLGYLPEEKGLYKKMKVAEVMIYFARLKGLPWMWRSSGPPSCCSAMASAIIRTGAARCFPRAWSKRCNCSQR